MEANYRGKYGKEGVGWHPCEVRGGYGVVIWKAIRGGISYLVNPLLKWVMEENLSFERIHGVPRSPCVPPSLFCMLWLCQSMLRWQICGKT